jgi:parallel beta-helix repeat protein
MSILLHAPAARLARSPRFIRGALSVLVALFALPVGAQPSGGPYGPIAQVYEIPTTGTVYYVAPDGDPNAPGTSLDRPTTIEAAIPRVVTGDTIVMRGGVYRTGSLQLNQGITIQPYRDEKPILKGTRVATQWQALRGGIWRTKWSPLFPARPLGWWQRWLEGMRTPLHRFNNDMVFVDGKLLKSVGWEGELDENSFYIDYEGGYVYIGVDPTDKLVEITAHDIALHRPSRPVHGKESDRKGPIIRGITFTQYAYRAIDIEGKKPSTTAEEEPTDDPVGVSDPANHGKEVVGTTLENVTISYTSRVAGYFRGDGLTIRNSLISDTGTEGIYVIGSSDVLLERNIIRRNNIEQLTGYYPAAVKIFNQSYRVTVRDNLIVEHPHSNGVWYDVGNVDGVFVNNYVEGTQIGFFFEISKGVVAAGNVFVNNLQGIRVLNSSNARIYHNTFFNSPVMVDRNERRAQGDLFGWHTLTGPDIPERRGHVFENNLLVAGEGFEEPLLRFEQPPKLCEEYRQEPMAVRVNNNTYVRTTTSDKPLVVWGPVRGKGKDCQSGFASLDELRKATGLETSGTLITPYHGTVFRSIDMRRFELAQPLPGVKELQVPAEALKATGWSTPARLPGAYTSAP